MNPNLKTITGALCLAACLSSAHAALNAYESFNYTTLAGGTAAPTGTPTQTTSGGYTGNWTFGGGATASLVDGGLTYPGLLTANKAVSLNTVGGSWIQSSLASPLSTGTYYISYLFKPGTSVNGGNNGAGFVDNGIQVAPGGIGFFLGIEAYGATAGRFTVMKTTQVVNGYNDNGTVAYQSSTSDITYGTVNLIVLKLVSTSANNWNGTIWVNPTAGTSSEPAASGTFTGIVCNGAIQAPAFLNRQGGNTLTFDEFRVATTWAEAVAANTQAAPTELGATPGGNSVSLSWTAASGAASYNVKRSTTSTGPYTIISTSGAVTGTSYTDWVAGGTTYYYVVSAVSAGGESANSAEVSATPTLGAPSAPTGLAAAPGDNQVALSWTASAVGSPTSYNVLRSTTSGSGYGTIGTTTAPTVAYTDSTAVNGTPYYYVVQAVNGFGTSADSTEVAATPAAYVGVYEPFNYTSLANGTNATGTGLTGNWTSSAAGTILAGLTYSGLPTANNSLRVNSGRTFVSFASTSTLSSGTKYISFMFNQPGNSGTQRNGVYFPNGGTGLFFGQGFNAFSTTQGYLAIGTTTTTGTSPLTATKVSSGNGFLYNFNANYFVVIKIVYPNTVSVYINPTANTGTEPGSPTLSATVNVGTITGIGVNIQGGSTVGIDEIRTGETYGSVVGYIPPPSAPTGVAATPGVNSVDVSWNAVSGATGYKVLRGTTTGIYPITNNVTASPFTDATAVGGTPYFYVVQATNATGASSISSEVTATPIIAVPDVPAGLTAIGTNSAVRISWSAASGAIGYNVKRSTTSGNEVTIAGVATTSYTDTAVVNGTPYFYTVSSTNAAGESADSSEVTATPDLPPAAPTAVAATPGANQVGLTWTGSAGAVSYHVKRSTISGSGYSTIGTTTDPTVAYNDVTAISGTQYYYVVSAMNAYGESSDSSPEAVATPTGVPQAPMGLTATAGITNISLSWTAALGGPTSYNVKRSISSGSGYVEISTPGTVTGTSYTDTTAAGDVPYYYVVSAVNGDGEGSDSTEVAATALPVPSPKLVFHFADTGTTTLSDPANGASNVSLTMYAGFGAARPNTITDLHGAPGSGVSGGGKALDLTGGTNAAATGPWGNNSALVPSMGFGNVPKWTASLWFKPTVAPTAMRLAALGGAGFCQEGQGTVIAIKTTGASAFQVWLGGTSATVTLGSPIPVNQWSFVAATYDGTNIRVYYGTDSTAANLMVTQPAAVTAAFGNQGWACLGAGDCDGTQTFKGYLDEFRFFSGGADAAFVEDLRVAALATIATTATVVSSANPSLPGANVTFTSTIAGVESGTPGGTVQFLTNGVSAASESLAGGSATYDTALLPHGLNTVTVAYVGDDNFSGSTNSVVQVVNTPTVASNFTIGAVSGAPVTQQIIGGKFAPTDADGDPLSVSAVQNPSSQGGTVSTDGTNLTYTSVGAFTGTDDFTYTVSDGFGTVTATITVVVAANGVGFNQVSPPVDNQNGTATISYLGIPGQNYALETTGSLTPPVVWTSVITNAAAGNGMLNFTFSTAEGQGYFRTRHVP